MDSAAQDRLWQYAMHEDTIFGERLNSFLTLESVLLALVAFLKQSQPQAAAARGSLLPWFVVLGGVLTLLLWFVQAKHRATLKIVLTAARSEFPEVKRSRETLTERWLWRLSATLVLAHVVPLVLLAVWGILYIYLRQ